MHPDRDRLSRCGFLHLHAVLQSQQTSMELALFVEVVQASEDLADNDRDVRLAQDSRSQLRGEGWGEIVSHIAAEEGVDAQGHSSTRSAQDPPAQYSITIHSLDPFMYDPQYLAVHHMHTHTHANHRVREPQDRS